jgi:cytidine deaminase
MDDKTKQALVQAAVEARKKAYAPYSKYFVGSALLTTEGKIFQGCNVENASYGLTCCSERVAIFKAVSEGVTDFLAIAVVTQDRGFPCGACRQVLHEFNPHLTVLIGNQEGYLVCETTLTALLPDAFGLHPLN